MSSSFAMYLVTVRCLQQIHADLPLYKPHIRTLEMRIEMRTELCASLRFCAQQPSLDHCF